jgi:hypothetical protein
MRAAGEQPLEPEVRDLLTTRIGHNAASRVWYMLKTSRCVLRSRSLSLDSVIRVYTEKLWETSFVAENGEIHGGVKQFRERFTTAHDAGRHLRDSLSSGDLAELRRILDEHFWSAIPQAAVSHKFAERLARVGALERRRLRRSSLGVLQSVKEAFALGLLQ